MHFDDICYSARVILFDISWTLWSELSPIRYNVSLIWFCDIILAFFLNIAYCRNELNKNAEDLIYHNLKSLLNKAITETNAQFDSNDILSRLDIRILIVSIQTFIKSHAWRKNNYLSYLKL